LEGSLLMLLLLELLLLLLGLLQLLLGETFLVG
jgi:hypothetical protein